MKLVVVILTKNEAIHLARCLANVRALTENILVVDSFSSDKTVQIAERHGARVLQRKWTNHANQFNWALEQLDANTEWVLRVDADERLSPALVADIRARLPKLGPEIKGGKLRIRVIFQGCLIRFGGFRKFYLLRLFRYGCGRLENIWMDEHTIGASPSITLDGEIINDDLRSLTFWTEKHNRYASLEAIEMLNRKHRFLRRATNDMLVARLWPLGTPASKRWLKKEVYASCPRGMRVCVWFLYRYVLQLGFLDGRAGRQFHVLQGFWYRYLADAKSNEVERRMSEDRMDVVTAIRQVLGIDLSVSGEAARSGASKRSSSSPL